jgi:hypothetical protein
MLRARPFFGFFILFIAVSMPGQKAGAQTALLDSSFRDSAINYVTSLYHTIVGKESNLYNGKERSPYNYPFLGGNPHFREMTFVPGSVYYDEMLYKEVPLLYDIVRDELILLHHDGMHQVNLVKEKVGWFSLDGHVFIHVLPGPKTNSLKPGYYEDLYSGGVGLLVKRAKTISERIENAAVYSITSNASVFYLFKDGNYFPVKNPKILLEQLKDKRAELNKFTRHNNIKFKRNIESAMTRIVAHYDQLKK